MVKMIRIAKVPDDKEHPLWVRQAWVGLKLLVFSEDSESYKVVVEQAVQILAKKDSEAASYWQDHAPESNFLSTNCFVFKKQFCEEIE